MFRRALLLFALSLFVEGVYPHSFLFKDGQSDYSIIICPTASPSEKTAATDFQNYVELISGVKLPILEQPRPTGSNVYIGYNDILYATTKITRPDDSDESFTYRTIGDNLYIYGGSQHGTMYGVYAFLEQQLGVRWYTSDFTKIPKMERFVLNTMVHSESPAFKYRLDYYYQAVKDKEWMAHNLLNTHTTLSDGKYGQLTACWGVHTFEKLIPPSDYFESHPDYFGVYKGERSDKTQLCLSNNEMFKELVKNLKQVILDKPGYWCYDVSQNDNSFPCECSECAALVTKYGGQSGALLWFVNKVAAEIKKTNPDVLIGTLAYRYTRHAPTSSIKPADNVVLRLCDIECCMAHPLEECEQNKDFLQDMDNWKRITKNIYIWDYTTGFHHYLLPFPNFDVLARNYQYFSRSNVVGILELGSWNAPWSEFSELKQWLIAKLLWNPDQNTDSLAALFINDYYDEAAPHVRKYYDLCRRQVNKDTHFAVNIEWDTRLYSDKFLTEAGNRLKKAITASHNKETLRRTNRLAAQFYYLQLRRHTVSSLANGTADKLKEINRNDSTVFREYDGSIDKLINDLSYY